MQSYKKALMTYVVGFTLVEFDAFEPLVNVVWVLSEQDRVEQQQSALDQVFKPRQAQIQVNVICNSFSCTVFSQLSNC